VICVTISIFQYVTDSFESHTASAQAAVIMLRCVSAGAIAEAAVPLIRQTRGGLDADDFRDSECRDDADSVDPV